MAESFRQGPAANLELVLAEIRPWGFQVAQVPFQKMFLWHGEQDRVAQALPHCTATFYSGDGHFSTLANHAQDIWTTMSG